MKCTSMTINDAKIYCVVGKFFLKNMQLQAFGGINIALLHSKNEQTQTNYPPTTSNVIQSRKMLMILSGISGQGMRKLT